MESTYAILKKPNKAGKLHQEPTKLDFTIPIVGEERAFDGLIIQDTIGNVVLNTNLYDLLSTLNQTIRPARNNYSINYSTNRFRARIKNDKMDVLESYFLILSLLQPHDFRTKFFNLSGLAGCPYDKKEIEQAGHGQKSILDYGFIIGLNDIRCTSNNLLLPPKPKDAIIPFGSLTVDEALCQYLGDPLHRWHFTVYDQEISFPA